MLLRTPVSRGIKEQLLRGAIGSPQGCAPGVALPWLRGGADWLESLGRVSLLQAEAEANDASLAPLFALLAEQRLPRLVVGGEDDTSPASDPQRIAAVAGMLGAEYVLVPGCAHFPHQEQPSSTARLLVAFFSASWREP